MSRLTTPLRAGVVPTSPGGALDVDRRSLARSTAVLVLGYGARVVLQGLLFLLLARELGPSSFGAYSAIAAVAAVLLPLTGLGRPFLMVRDVVRAPDTAGAVWREVLRTTLVSGAVLVVSGVALVRAVGLSAELTATVVLLLLADTVGVRLVEAVGLLWQARGSSAWLAALPNVVNGLRLLGLATLVITDSEVTLNSYAPVHLLGAALPALAAVCLTSRKVGPVRSLPEQTRSGRFRAGMTFSFSGAASTVNNDVDKALLSAMVSTGAAGIYAAAYRIADMAYVPMRALTAAVFPRYFRDGGAGGSVGALSLARAMVRWNVAYGVLAGVALVLVAPWVTALLGAGYSDSQTVLQGLAALLVLRGAGLTAADALAGAGHNAGRMTLQIVAAMLNVALNVALIPQLGVHGAVVATLVSEATFAVSAWALLIRRAAVERAGRNVGRSLPVERAS